MERDLSALLTTEYLENGKRILLYGPPYTGKSFLLRQLSENPAVKNYLYCDLNLDREFRDGLIAALRSEESLCRYISGFFAVDYNTVLKDTHVFLDGLEALGECASELCRTELPGHIAAATSEMTVFANSRENKDYPFREVKISGLSFYEFLTAVSGPESYRDVLRAHYKNKRPIPELIEETIRELFHDYLMTGGYPEAVLTYLGNRTDLSAIRHTHELLYSGTILRYKDLLPKGLSFTKLIQLLSYIKHHADDCRSRFHPGRIRRGALLSEFLSELNYLAANSLITPVYLDDTLYRYELSDCGLLRYLCNDYDTFFRLDRNEALPEYFYQNYFYKVLADRNIRITALTEEKYGYLCYTNGTLSFKHSGRVRHRNQGACTTEGSENSPFEIRYLVDSEKPLGNTDHNIQYYYLEQTQF